MSSGPPAQCMSCARWRPGLLNGTEDQRQTCEAYPDGIPAQIWINDADHRQPQPGDHGLRWKSVDGEPFPAWLLEAH